MANINPTRKTASGVKNRCVELGFTKEEDDNFNRQYALTIKKYGCSLKYEFLNTAQRKMYNVKRPKKKLVTKTPITTQKELINKWWL